MEYVEQIRQIKTKLPQPVDSVTVRREKCARRVNTFRKTPLPERGWSIAECCSLIGQWRRAFPHYATVVSDFIKDLNGGTIFEIDPAKAAVAGDGWG